jgi:ferredoxin
MIGSASPKYIDEELKLLFRELFAEQSERKLKYYELNKDIFTMPYIFQVIPKWRTIKDLPGILPCEDTRSIFKRSKQIVIINCPCKTWYPRTEECKENIPHESCIVGLGVARYEMKRGTGREISYEECMDILDCLDQQQIVQTASFTNSQSIMPYGVCNCHPCCCGFFVGDRFNQSHTNPNFSAIAPSRYSAETDPAKCIACRKCIDTRCPFGAITMQYYPEFNGVRARVDDAKCKGCGLCVLTCPSKAKKMKVVRPPEFIPDVTQLIAQQNSGSGNEEFFI